MLHSELFKEFPLCFGQWHCLQRRNFSWKPAFLFPAKDTVCLADSVALYGLTDLIPSGSAENGKSKDKLVASKKLNKFGMFSVYFDKLLFFSLEKIIMRLFTTRNWAFFLTYCAWHIYFITHGHQNINLFLCESVRPLWRKIRATLPPGGSIKSFRRGSASSCVLCFNREWVFLLQAVVMVLESKGDTASHMIIKLLQSLWKTALITVDQMNRVSVLFVS